jgi:hypothetical protein
MAVVPTEEMLIFLPKDADRMFRYRVFSLKGKPSERLGRKATGLNLSDLHQAAGLQGDRYRSPLPLEVAGVSFLQGQGKG